MSGPETITAAFNSLLALLADARNEMGHDPSAGRAISIAITHAENAQLWADKAFSGQQALDEGLDLSTVVGDEADLSAEIDERTADEASAEISNYEAEQQPDDPTDGAPVDEEDPE